MNPLGVHPPASALRGAYLALRLGVCALAFLAPAVAQGYQITKFYVEPAPGVKPATTPAGINSAGAVVGSFGFSHDELPYMRGFIRMPDGTLHYPIIDPNDIDHQFTALTSVNDSGVIAGYYISAADHGFLLSGATFTDIDLDPGGSTAILSINNNGDYAGAIGPEAGPSHGFISIGGNVTQVDIKGYASTLVTSLGDDGASVGFAIPPKSNVAVGFVRAPGGGIHRFSAAGAAFLGTYPTGINTEAKLIVGYSYDSRGVVRGFVFHYTKALDEVGPLAGADAAPGALEVIDAVKLDAAAKGNTFITGVNANGVITGYWQDPATGAGPFGFIGTPIQ